MIKAVLFDLDGTLLPMDEEIFIKGYFAALIKKISPHGYDQDQLVSGIWKATKFMMTNFGDKYMTIATYLTFYVTNFITFRFSPAQDGQ